MWFEIRDEGAAVKGVRRKLKGFFALVKYKMFALWPRSCYTRRGSQSIDRKKAIRKEKKELRKEKREEKKVYFGSGGRGRRNPRGAAARGESKKLNRKKVDSE